MKGEDLSSSGGRERRSPHSSATQTAEAAMTTVEAEDDTSTDGGRTRTGAEAIDSRDESQLSAKEGLLL